MWYQVDEKAISDLRIKFLGRQLGMSHAEAFLLMNRVWLKLYKQAGAGEGILFDPIALDLDFGIDGLAESLVLTDLAEVVAGGAIRCRGAERAEALAKVSEAQSERAKRGWEKRKTPMPRHSPGNAPAMPPAMPGHVESNGDYTEDARAMPRQSPGNADTKKVFTYGEDGSGRLFSDVAPSSPPESDPRPVGRSSARAGVVHGEATARGARALPYSVAEVFAVLGDAMGDLFSAELAGGGKLHQGMAAGVTAALKQAAAAGYTLEDFAAAGRRVAGLMREKGMADPVTPAWVATTDPNKSSLLRAVVQHKALAARASPERPRQTQPLRGQAAAERARRMAEEEQQQEGVVREAE
jgi:hypothetical protein